MIAKPKQVPEDKKIFNFAEPDDKPQKILGFSGKIGAGKTSHCNFIFALAFVHLLQRTPEAFVNEEGKLVCLDKDNRLMVVDMADRSPEAIRWNLQENVYPFIRLFSVAEPLKKIATEMFGIPYKNLYGTQNDKLEKINLRWEDMPTLVNKSDQIIPYKTGQMTGRDFLEYFGTEIMRKIDPSCHAKALAKSIKAEDPYYGTSYISLIDDCRFVDEVEAIQSIGGKVIRLTRETEEGRKNNHSSNCDLDNFDGFDYVIDNEDLTMEESFSKLMEVLFTEGWFTQIN